MNNQSGAELLRTATMHHRAGRFSDARRLYGQLLARAPAHTLTLYCRGLLELQDGHPDAALPLAARVAAAESGEPRYQYLLGQVLQALRRWDEAVNAYQSAVGLQPDFADAWINLGICCQVQRQFPRAASAYRRALALDPANASVMGNLGTVLRESGELPEAIRLLRTAMAQEPAVSLHAVNLSIAHAEQGDRAAAGEALREWLTRESDDPEVAFNLGNALQCLGRQHEAIERYRRAVALRPGYADALINLGNALRDTGELAAGLAAFEAALAARPDSVVAMNNAGCLLRMLGRIDEADAVLRCALQQDPGNPVLHDSIANVCKDAGNLDAAVASYRRALQLDPRLANAHSNLAYALNFQSADPAPILQECLRWNESFAAPLARRAHRHPGRTEADRRLRIGYLSPDFRNHVQSLFTIPLLSAHDHAAFEIYCYFLGSCPDDHTRRIAGYADVWREAGAIGDEPLARLIGADGIDILVDLTMHMAGGRPRVLARKPAPVQIAWLAYPGTTGIGAMDYRLTDPRLDPVGCDAHYSERSLRLPDSFWCYDPLSDGPAVSDPPVRERGYPTLGCLNNPCKVTDHTLRLWGGVMHGLPNARLLLMAPPGLARRQLSQRLEACGVAAERVEFRSYQPRSDYLRSYHDIDLSLDTFPYNGHTTSFDSMWMGVPVVTRVGRTCVGRGGLSQLYQLDLLELAAEFDQAFVDVAVALGKDPERLAMLRRELRARLAGSPLMDAPRFARNVELAYRGAWRSYCTDD